MVGMPDVSEAVAWSSRLLLCRPTLSDEPAVCALRQDSRVMRFLGGGVDERTASSRFRRDIAHWDAHGYGKCVVCHRETGSFVGLAGMQLFEGEPDLGYLLTPGWWGRGLATEGAQALLAYGFETLDLRLVRALVSVPHRASRRVLAKAGMRYLRDRVLDGDRHHCYAITAAQWQSRTYA